MGSAPLSIGFVGWTPYSKTSKVRFNSRNRFQFPRWPLNAEYWRHPNRSSTATGMKIPKFTPQVPLKETNHGDVNVTSKMWFCPNFSITPENPNKTKWAIYLGHEEMICIVLYCIVYFVFVFVLAFVVAFVIAFAFALYRIVLYLCLCCIVLYCSVVYDISYDIISYDIRSY